MSRIDIKRVLRFLEPDFNDAKLLSDYVGIIVRMAFCQGFAQLSYYTWSQSDDTSIKSIALAISAIVFTFLSIQLGIGLLLSTSRVFMELSDSMDNRLLKVLMLLISFLLVIILYYAIFISINYLSVPTKGAAA